MNLKQLIGEHTIDVDLLPEEPLVLDVGCRYYDFCEEIFALRPKARIIAFDPATDVLPPSPPDSRIQFFHLALIEGSQDRVWMRPNGWIVELTPQDGLVEVSVMSMAQLLSRWPYFDLIKLDCEGSEFQLLEHWPGPCATQINVEFHDIAKSWEGVSGRVLPQSYFDGLMAGPLKDYKVIQNEPDHIGNHTDCLLVLNRG
jgi:hypothetical protein